MLRSRYSDLTSCCAEDHIRHGYAVPLSPPGEGFFGAGEGTWGSGATAPH